MTRTRSNWKARDHVFTIGERTLIMGVLNVTPDSFSDGGRYMDPDAAAARAMELEQHGADIIDIGAESTKPGSERINAGEELRRLVPVLKRLKGQLSVPICVDTYKAEVAEKALEHGASIINDVSALTWEADIVKPVIKYDAGLVLNHMRGTPETWARLAPMKDVMGTLLAELEAAVHRATRAGVARERVVIDPGIGFGKRGEQNSEILARLSELQRLLLPVLVGASRKSFLAQEDRKALEFATAAAVTTAILHGAAIVRVHDVEAMKPVVQTVDAIIEATPEREEKSRPIKPRVDADIRGERRGQPIRPPAREKKQEPPVIPPPAPVRDEPSQERPRRPFERRPAAQGAPPERRPERDRPEKRPFQKQDRPFRPREDQGGDRSEKRPFQKRDRPSRPREDQGGDRPEKRPFQKRDRPFRPREDQGGDKPGKRPFQKRDRPFRPREGQGDDKPERRPFQRGGPPKRQGAGDRPDRRPQSGRPFDKRDGSKFGGERRPSGPRKDNREGGPGGERPPGGNRPFRPKGPGGPPKRSGGPPRRPGGPPRGGPKKRS